MINLIKLMVAMALASFSVNASAIAMADHNYSWGSMSSPSSAREHRTEEKKAAKEHRKEHRSSQDVSRKHLKVEKKAAKKHVNKHKRLAKKQRAIKKKVKHLLKDLRKVIAKCGWLCDGDNDFDLSGKKHKIDLHKLKHAYAKMDKRHGNYDRKPPKHDNNPGSGPGNSHNVPEPGMVALLAIGLLGMIVARRKFRV